MTRPKDWDHQRDVTGHFIGGDLTPLQDGGEEPCTDCGRRIPHNAPSWHHAIGCANYSPHPNSIAYTKEQTP